MSAPMDFVGDQGICCSVRTGFAFQIGEHLEAVNRQEGSEIICRVWVAHQVKGFHIVYTVMFESK